PLPNGAIAPAPVQKWVLHRVQNHIIVDNERVKLSKKSQKKAEKPMQNPVQCTGPEGFAPEFAPKNGKKGKKKHPAVIDRVPGKPL
ncbi:MAG: hypothetical protein IKB22_04510, partial [Lentisphaeria bacterium]|nr:hypothetical protein [Lentisphaeria bacterium]